MLEIVIVKTHIYVDNRAYESYGIWKWMHIQILRLEQKKKKKWKMKVGFYSIIYCNFYSPIFPLPLYVSTYKLNLKIIYM